MTRRARAYATPPCWLTPLSAEILCSFFVYEFDKSSFSPLCEQPTDENILLSDLKKQLAEKLGCDPKLLRVRGTAVVRRVGLPR